VSSRTNKLPPRRKEEEQNRFRFFTRAITFQLGTLQ
jgi:hypothetical protein